MRKTLFIRLASVISTWVGDRIRLVNVMVVTRPVMIPFWDSRHVLMFRDAFISECVIC
jgi:hypothetical protein